MILIFDERWQGIDGGELYEMVRFERPGKLIETTIQTTLGQAA